MKRFGIHHLRDLPAGLQTLLLSSFLIPLGSFMVLPFIPIILNRHADMSMSLVGIVLAIASLIQFGGGFIGGFIADHCGLKPTMIGALIVRTLGFSLLTAAYWQGLFIIPAIMLIATGAALYLPANKAYIVNAAPQENRALFLSLSNAALNAGMGLGPLIGGLFIMHHARTLFAVVMLIFMVLTLVHYRGIPAVQCTAIATKRNKHFSFVDLRILALPFTFNALSFYCYFFFQNYMGPYVSVLYSPQIYSFILLLNALLVFLLQPLMSGWIKRTSYGALLSLSFLLMACGMALIMNTTLTALFIGTALITVTEICLFLKNDLEMLDKLPHRPAVAFGFQRLSAGMGAFASGALGGWLFEVTGKNGHQPSFWLFLALQSTLLALFSAYYWRIHLHK